MELVRPEPHIFTAAGHSVDFLGAVQMNGPFMKDPAYICMTFENSDCFRI
jgi:hypothetical protein